MSKEHPHELGFVGTKRSYDLIRSHHFVAAAILNQGTGMGWVTLQALMLARSCLAGA